LFDYLFVLFPFLVLVGHASHHFDLLISDDGLLLVRRTDELEQVHEVFLHDVASLGSLDFRKSSRLQFFRNVAFVDLGPLLVLFLELFGMGLEICVIWSEFNS